MIALFHNYLPCLIAAMLLFGAAGTSASAGVTSAMTNPDLKASALVVDTKGPLRVAKKSLALDNKEKAWFSRHKTIRAAFDGYFPPYGFLNDDGKFEGLSVDVMRALAERAGITLELSQKTVWKELYEAAKQREVDVVASLKFSAIYDRDRFTESIAVRKDWPEPASILDKAQGSIADDEMTELHRRWVGPAYEPGLSHRTFLKYLAAMLVLVLLMVSGVVSWNRALRSEVSQKTVELQKELLERERSEEKGKIVTEELLAINRIVQACSSTLDPNAALNIAMDEALQITGLEGGTICFVGPDETLHLAAHREASEATIADLNAHVVKVGDCLCGECARTRQPLILRDREAVLKFSTREATRGEDIRFHAAFPLILKEKCLGVLCVFTRTDLKPSDRGLALLETITSQIALAIENAQLHENSLRHAAVLEDMVRARTAELEAKIAEIERMNKLFVGRELKMIELKERIKELDKKFGTQSSEFGARES